MQDIYGARLIANISNISKLRLDNQHKDSVSQGALELVLYFIQNRL